MNALQQYSQAGLLPHQAVQNVLAKPQQYAMNQMNMQSVKSQMQARELKQNALSNYAQTGDVMALAEGAPDVYMSVLKQQGEEQRAIEKQQEVRRIEELKHQELLRQEARPDNVVTSIGGTKQGMMQRAIVNRNDPYAKPVPFGGQYMPFNPYADQSGYPADGQIEQPPIPQIAPVSAPGQPPQQELMADGLPPNPDPMNPAIKKIMPKDGIWEVPYTPIPGLSPQDNAAQRRDERKADKQLIADMQKTRGANTKAMADVDRFLHLNKQTETGGIAGSLLVGTARKVLGEEAYTEMDAIASRLIPNARPEGSGTMSDSDRDMFEAGTIGTKKGYAVNKNMGLGLKVSAQLQNDKIDFMQQFFDKNTHLQKAESMWVRYLNANPIFDPKAPVGSYTMNPNRQGWKDFISGTFTPKTVMIGNQKVKISDPKKYRAFLKDSGQ